MERRQLESDRRTLREGEGGEAVGKAVSFSDQPSDICDREEWYPRGRAFTPKGSNNKAQGRERSERTLGIYHISDGNSVRVPQTQASVPDVPLIYGHAILATQTTKFILVRFRLMMLLLLRYIRLSNIEVIGTERERTVAVLLMEVADMGLFDLDPFRRIAFQFADKARDVESLRQPHQQMHVVRDAADNDGRAILILANAGEIGVHAIAKCLVGQEWLAVPC
ncbi:MAG TPA: hypothetical protein VFE62_21370 [Gemmataceae bacterium]|nr:hypothetical protein [Gemmataceae bacterium]